MNIRSHAKKASAFVAFWPVFFLFFNAVPAAVAEDLFLQIADANKQRDADVHEVRSVRRYILHNNRWANDSFADVLVIINREGHERYEILETTAKGMQREIFKRILDGEVEASKTKQADITPENYETKSTGTRVVNGKSCEVLELIPRKKTKYLLEGWACVDPQDKAIIHVEGRTAKSVSFWVGKAYVTQDFRKVGPFWYSTVSKSSADVKFLGNTQLTIQYIDYQITPKQGPALVACRKSGCSPELREAVKQVSMVR